MFVCTAPLVLPAAALADLATRARLARVRVLLFVGGYLACEVLGLLGALGVWLALRRGPGAAAFLETNFRLQVRWASTLFGLARRCFAFREEVDVPALPAGNVLVFCRHVSLVDALLPTVFVSARTGRHLRFVMKRELLLDPCLDVVGQRLPNAFITRGAKRAEEEVASLRELALGLGAGEGVALFPEGTRFTEAGRAAALARMRAAGDTARLARTSGLRHVLPPRSRGALAVLDAAPQAHVLFLAHHGLESAGRLGPVLRGGLIGRRIRVRGWLVEAHRVPREPEACLAWLDGEWQRLDDWLESCERDGLG